MRSPYSMFEDTKGSKVTKSPTKNSVKAQPQKKKKTEGKKVDTQHDF
jgi:hypothetical protein